MSTKQSIQKNISFDNFEDFVKTITALKDKKTVQNLNFGGNFRTDEATKESVLSLNVNWVEEETF